MRVVGGSGRAFDEDQSDAVRAPEVTFIRAGVRSWEWEWKERKRPENEDF